LHLRTLSASDLEQAVASFVRGFGLLERERTPCGLDLHVSEAHPVASATRPTIRS
jgi:hypothetical protein